MQKIAFKFLPRVNSVPRIKILSPIGHIGASSLQFRRSKIIKKRTACFHCFKWQPDSEFWKKYRYTKLFLRYIVSLEEKDIQLNRRASETSTQLGCCKRNAFLIMIALILLAVMLAIIFGLWYKYNKQQHRIGSVVSNCPGCAEIGGNILREGGSAVDAIIATLLCEGVILPHSLGLGGGFVATIYTKETGKVETLIARESAPLAAHRDMFIDKKITGAIAAGVPGEIYGYWHLHQKYGKLPWHMLFEPTIRMCLRGHKVSEYLANVLVLNEEQIKQEPSMAEIFINPKTCKVFKEGEVMYRPQLGRTLQAIAAEGAGVIYDGGRIGQMLAEDVQRMGGIITIEDLMLYDVRWEEPIVAHMAGGYTVYTTPLPTSGVLLAFILNVMNPLYTDRHEIYWQRVIETFKHAYGYRTHLGDACYEPDVGEVYHDLTCPSFAAEIRKLIRDFRTYTNFSYYCADFSSKESRGTANVCILAPNGDAISVTSTVNSHLGAKVRSRRTGIILNDEMDDFSTPGVVNAYGIPSSPANYIKPGKVPMSSTCPAIAIDKCGQVRMLVGGAGGSKITTSVAQAILRYLVLNESLEMAINTPRIHHQLAPMYVDIEPGVDEDIITYLRRVGHKLNYLPGEKAFSALTAIGLKSGKPVPVCDIRRLGSIAIVREGQ